ncbi:hypothetical protein HWV62_39824 [Athelia sp. TMB]|nr:hypothetical protein HWV62_39824 [Athelia sp. TMB]
MLSISRSDSSTTTTASAASASPTPISPFSTYSLHSEATSDEQPDLGAFTVVFRALNNLQPPRSFAIPGAGEHSPSLSSAPITSEADSDAPGRIIAAYLGVTSASEEDDEDDDDEDESVSGSEDEDEVSGSGSDTEGEPEGRLVEIEGYSDVDADGQPSLGLEEALSFIASERERYAAQRDKGSTADSDWKHVIEPKRKRRRKKSKNGSTVTETTTEDDTGGLSCSSLDIQLTASLPVLKTVKDPAAKERRLLRKIERKLLRRSKSTLKLDSVASATLDPHVIQLRSLTHKLRHLFPEDSAALSAVLSNNFAGSSTLGPIPQPHDTLIHVFIDHSNILIGLLAYLRRYHRNYPRKPKHMSHAALALILERGRPITRRCVVTSSPLYQPMDSAEQLGYEVRVYARVPDTGDGDDRRKSADYSGSNGNSNSNSNSNNKNHKGHWRQSSGASFKKGHAHKGSSGGNTSTESEQSGSSSNAVGPQAFLRKLGSQATIRPSISGSQSQSSSQAASGAGTPTNVRIRYREQGVDELLQLKLHQAIADVDDPPPGATIVLATGDGNVGQFNEDGFLGPVRTALKKGWRVELYAWAEGLSKAWRREFGEGPYKDRFKVIDMETFGVDLMEV